MLSRRRAAPAFRRALPFVLCAASAFAAGWSLARAPDKPQVDVLLQSGETILGQPVRYPEGRAAKVTAAIITMAPGQSTGWHKHDVPLFAYLLDGEITVDYGAEGRRVYKKGDAFLEAIVTPHNGRSTGDVPARLVAVFAGAEGVRNTEAVAEPGE